MNLPQAIIDLRNLRSERGKRLWRTFMEKYNCQTICEVGVFEGRNFMRMIEHKPQIAVAVDAWVKDGTDSHDDSGYPQEALNNLYRRFMLRVAKRPFVKVYREYSDDAVRHFPDEYFDIVYIDADHTYKGCLKDIEAWYPKVKKGKFLVGDDYRSYVNPIGVVHDVKKAVDEFAQKNNLVVYELPVERSVTGWGIVK